MMNSNGLLTIVGLGIKELGHITAESRQWIERADQVFYLANGAASEAWVAGLNPASENLARYYGRGKRRIESYKEMVCAMLEPVRAGKRVCAVFYGHPGIFVWPSHAAIRQARSEGLRAQMLPGISAEDCLFADLGIDPAKNGCQSYEATDFLVRPREFDIRTGLVLWQIGVVGSVVAPIAGAVPLGLAILVGRLQERYGDQHQVFIYEAAQTAGEAAFIQYVALCDIQKAKVSAVSTMYVPPKEKLAVDLEMMARLGLTQEMLRV